MDQPNGVSDLLTCFNTDNIEKQILKQRVLDLFQPLERSLEVIIRYSVYTQMYIFRRGLKVYSVFVNNPPLPDQPREWYFHVSEFGYDNFPNIGVYKSFDDLVDDIVNHHPKFN